MVGIGVGEGVGVGSGCFEPPESPVDPPDPGSLAVGSGALWTGEGRTPIRGVGAGRAVRAGDADGAGALGAGLGAAAEVSPGGALGTSGRASAVSATVAERGSAARSASSIAMATFAG